MDQPKIEKKLLDMLTDCGTELSLLLVRNLVPQNKRREVRLALKHVRIAREKVAKL